MGRKKQDNGLADVVIKKSKDKNIKKSILEVDDLINHHLELLDDKEAVVKKVIKDINKTATKRKIKRKNNHEYFDSLNDYFKGKLFYIAYKESNKYLKIPEIEKAIDKQTLLNFVTEIETGQEYAWDIIDNLRNETLKNFLYGIFTYLYF